jgi:hypothetical protein
MLDNPKIAYYKLDKDGRKIVTKGKNYDESVEKNKELLEKLKQFKKDE